MKREIYKPPTVKIIRVVMEQNIAQVNISVKLALEPWEEELVPVGEDPDTEGGDFYVFY